MKRVFFLGGVALMLLRRLIHALIFESPLLVAARHPWYALAVIVTALAIGGLVVVASGIVPMKASTGHWTITARFLHFAMRQSVVTHAVGITAPPLDDEALLMRGAVHFDLGCRPCHGGAAGDVPMIASRIVPPPRPLAVHARDWRPNELFYIIKHGMKFTAMPAWPFQQRDDEVWSMVAFVSALPSLSQAEYERLVRSGPPEPLDLVANLRQAPDVVRTICARCHGVDGTGRGTGAFPNLAGQRAEYMDNALRAYATGQRYSGIMGPIAAALSEQGRRDAVAHYASLPAPPPAPAPSGASPGHALASEGRPDELIPPCMECHGPAAMPKNPAIPRLAGQYPEYLANQLRLLREGRRGGSDFLHLMRPVAGRLSDDQIEDVARYFASVPE